jgi:hypothetical protein
LARQTIRLKKEELFRNLTPIRSEGRVYLGDYGEHHSEFLPQDRGVVDFHYLLQEAFGAAVKFEAAVIPKPPYGSLDPLVDPARTWRLTRGKRTMCWSAKEAS